MRLTDLHPKGALLYGPRAQQMESQSTACEAVMDSAFLHLAAVTGGSIALSGSKPACPWRLPKGKIPRYFPFPNTTYLFYIFPQLLMSYLGTRALQGRVGRGRCIIPMLFGTLCSAFFVVQDFCF